MKRGMSKASRSQTLALRISLGRRQGPRLSHTQPCSPETGQCLTHSRFSINVFQVDISESSDLKKKRRRRILDLGKWIRFLFFGILQSLKCSKSTM